MGEAKAEIRTVKLGGGPLDITPIGLGAWQFSEGKGGARGSWDPVDADTTDDIVQTALEGGMSWFDTAELYGWGRSESALSRALIKAGKKPGDVVIATKWSPIGRFAGNIKKTFPKRSASLTPFPVDLHQVHAPISFSKPETEMNMMADLLQDQQIRAAGVSNFGVGHMERAHRRLRKHGFSLAANQVKYNLLHRKIESNGLLDTAKALGVTIIAYSPLQMGLLTGKFHDDPSMLKSRPIFRRKQLAGQMEKSRPLINELKQVAEKHEATVSQVALAWVIQFHGDAVVAIPGATKPRHAEENAGAMRIQLGEEELDRIDDLSKTFL